MKCIIYLIEKFWIEILLLSLYCVLVHACLSHFLEYLSPMVLLCEFWADKFKFFCLISTWGLMAILGLCCPSYMAPPWTLELLLISPISLAFLKRGNIPSSFLILCCSEPFMFRLCSDLMLICSPSKDMEPSVFGWFIVFLPENWLLISTWILLVLSILWLLGVLAPAGLFLD